MTDAAPRRRKKAAALRYHQTDDAAPRVLATGQGETADEIVDIAKKAGIPVHADPQLVELLAALDVGSCIPEELYTIVAEVLVFVHEMDQGFVPLPERGAAPLPGATPSGG